MIHEFSGGPPGVRLGQVLLSVPGADHPLKLTQNPLAFEGALVLAGVQHAGQPIGEVLCFPNPFKRCVAVAVQQGRGTRLEEGLKRFEQDLDIGQSQV